MTEDNLAIIKVGDEDRVAHDFEGAVLGEQESLAGDEGNFPDGWWEVLLKEHDRARDLSLDDGRRISKTAGGG